MLFGTYELMIVFIKMIGPGGVITGTSEPYLPGHNTYSGMTMETEEEPEVIRLFLSLALL
jgi:hypothetical protein